MWKLLNVALAAALGFAVNVPSYAADKPQTSQTSRSTAWSDAEIRTAMDKCNNLNLTGTPEAKCIVNIRPTPGDKVAMTPYSSAAGNTVKNAESNTVKDGTAIVEAEYAAAVKTCESVNAADMDGCINTAKEHFGRM